MFTVDVNDRQIEATFSGIQAFAALAATIRNSACMCFVIQRVLRPRGDAIFPLSSAMPLLSQLSAGTDVPGNNTALPRSVLSFDQWQTSLSAKRDSARNSVPQ